MIKIPYNICEFCNLPIKIHKFKKHRKMVHPNVTSKESDPELLKKLLNTAKDSDKSKGCDPLSLFFEIAKLIFSEIEQIDTSKYTFVYASQLKGLIETAIPTTITAPYPPTMMHLKTVVKDPKIYAQVLEKYKGTEIEKIIKEEVKGVPRVIVFKRNYANLVLEKLSNGAKSSDIMVLTVFFYLHEMYHINGCDEKDSDVKAANAILEIFGIRIVIPDYELERWKEHKRFRKERRAAKKDK